ncbi:MAG: metallopeptidase family protein [Rubrobacter sp.]|nr:metallopeptidase family protein [Rubrobacter sp.]
MKRASRDFGALVDRALDGLPPELAALLDNVAVMVEDWPDRETLEFYDEETMYGLYEGVPLTERDHSYAGALPDRITIFQGPLEQDFDQHELEEQVRVTVIHEIAHHFGFDEDRIAQLGWG